MIFCSARGPIYAMGSLAEIDVLARLQLAARRCGVELRFQCFSDELRELIAFAGLEGALGLEPRRKPEEREQRLRVQEEGELDDPPV
jgi:hypothetical protein